MSSLRRLTSRLAPGVVLTLGIGLTATATLTTLVEDLYLRPPSGITEPERLRVLSASVIQSGRSGIGFTQDGFEALSTLRAWDALAAFSGVDIEVTLGSGVDGRRLRAELVSGGYFDTLGARTSLGRLIEAADDDPAAPAVAVLSRSAFLSLFGGDPSVVGRADLEIDGRSYRLAGVAPAGFTGATRRDVDIWMPLQVSAATSFPLSTSPYRVRWLSLVGRLAERWTPAAADEEASALFVAAEVEAQSAERTWVVTSTTLLENLRLAAGDQITVLRWLGAVSTALLLISLFNACGFLLARGLERREELAIRAALGSSRSRLYLGLVGDALAPAVLAGFSAVVLSGWLGALGRASLRPGDAIAGSFSPIVLASSSVLTLAATLFAASVVAALLLRADPADALRNTDPGVFRGARLRSSLLAAQVLLTTVLLVSSQQFLASLLAARAVDHGVRTDGLWIVRWDSERTHPVSPEPTLEAAQRAVEALRRNAAVERAALGGGDPFRWSITTRIRVPGNDSGELFAHARPIGSQYDRTVGLELLQGRWFDGEDHRRGAATAVVSRAMAERFWPQGNAVGECFSGTGAGAPCLQIIGIVADVLEGSPAQTRDAVYYTPIEQAQTAGPEAPAILLRAPPNSDLDVLQIRGVMAGALPDLRFVEAVPYREAMSTIYRDWTLGTTLFSIYGATALVLAAAGLFAALRFDLRQRRFELSIRKALGAPPRTIAWHTWRSALVPTLLGCLLGLPTAWAASRLYKAHLFDISPASPVPYVSAILVLLGAAALACVMPARRAALTSPLEVLRHD